MPRVIYYFTGTGNSLDFATKLARVLDATMIPMTDDTVPQTTSDDCVGLIYPTYMYRPPRLVVRFISKLTAAKYLYVVAINGGEPGDVLERSAKILKQQGLEMNAGFKVALPDNYTPFGGPPEQDKQQEMFSAADVRVKEIAAVISGSAAHRDPKPGWFKTTIHPALWYSLGYWAIPTSDRNFWLNGNCVGCESCSKICPVRNIAIVDNRPQWNGHCEQCFACLQWCNKQAIELGKKTAGVARYRNPNIKRKQLIQRPRSSAR